MLHHCTAAHVCPLSLLGGAKMDFSVSGKIRHDQPSDGVEFGGKLPPRVRASSSSSFNGWVPFVDQVLEIFERWRKLTLAEVVRWAFYDFLAGSYQ